MLLAAAFTARLLWPGRPDLAFFPASGEPSNRARLDFPKDVTYVSSFWIVAVWVVDDVIRIIQGSTDRDGRAGGRRTVMCLRLILIAVALWLSGWAIMISARRWNTIVEFTGVSITEILLVALIPTSLAIITIGSALLNTPRLTSDDDAFFFHGPNRPVWWVATLIPALVMAGTIAIAQIRRVPGEGITAPTIAAEGLPTAPTTFAPDPAWDLDLIALDDIVGGAAGPVILTPDKVQGLDPADGSVTWSFCFKDIASNNSEMEAGNSVIGKSSRLITSPDHRYVSLRRPGPGIFLDNVPEWRTVVLDTVSGAVVTEHLSDGGRLQLTDSAVLDGRDAYSLEDGSRMWTLPKESKKTYDSPPRGYSGPAGHSSFVLDPKTASAGNNAAKEEDTSVTTLTVAPQSNPSATQTVERVLTPIDEGLVVSTGWIAVLADDGAQAVSLDSLAGVDGADTTRTGLGTASSVNRQASMAANRLVTVPPPPEGTHWATDRPLRPTTALAGMVGSVFDPATGAVTDATHTPGLAAARIGITIQAAGDDVENRLTIAPGDGSEGVSRPVDATTSYLAPSIGVFNPWLVDSEQIRLSSSESGMTALSTPGVTLVVQVTGLESRSDTVRLIAFPGAGGGS